LGLSARGGEKRAIGAQGCVRTARRTLFALAVALSGLVHVSIHARESAPAAPQFGSPEHRERLARAFPGIEAMMRERMEALGIPGLSYAIVIGTEDVAEVRGLGVRDIGTREAVSVETAFPIASLTKSFVALAVLQLRDQGALSLDDPVQRYVPEVAHWKPATGDAGPVTIRQLLTMASGLPEDNAWADRQIAGTSDSTFTHWLTAGVPFAFSTGSGHEYSNYGYAILGLVVSRVTGRPYERVIEQEILRPLGMESTRWSLRDLAPERRARGYRKGRDGPEAEPALDHSGPFGAAMGLVSSATDFARWVSLFLSAYPPRDGPESAPAHRRTLREMQMGSVLPELVVQRPPSSPLVARAGSYGFGLYAVHDCLWGREVSHLGGLPGFGSHMRWLPDHGVGVLVLANLTYAQAGSLTRGALTLLHATGALMPRPVVPSPALQQVASRVAQLVDRWDDALARSLAADNLWLDQPLDDRRVHIAGLREKLGACNAEALQAQTALRGEFRLVCDRGVLTVNVALAPTMPPLVQTLEVLAAPDASKALEKEACVP
jgi:CubicO group peptidase (beta-lactamase class C family)